MVKITESEIRLETEPGRSIRSALHLEAEDADRVRGELYSDHARIIPELEQFSGRKMRLRFGVDVTGLRDGDTVNGHLLVVTDSGEQSVPVAVRIRRAERRTGESEAKDLASFASLAEQGPEEAFGLFMSPGFGNLIPADDPERASLLALHRGLAVPGASMLAMEEFLLAAGLKQPVTVTADVSEVRYDRIKETVMEQVTLRRSSWGSLLILAETEGDFLSLPKSVLTDEDFVGRTCIFSFLIDRSRLGTGMRFGRIRFRAPQGTFEVRVTATAMKKDEADPAVAADRLELTLFREMTDWCCGRTDNAALADRLEETIDRLRQVRPERTAALKLLWSFALETGGRHADAQTVLRGVTEGEKAGEPEEILMAIDYMEGLTGLAKLKREAFASRVRSCAARRPDSWLMLRLMVRTSPDLWRSGRRILELTRNAFVSGCRSPFLYAQAFSVLKQEEDLLERLDPFMLRILLFAARREMLTEGLLLRAAFLSDHEKTFNGLLFRVLTEGYRRMPLDGVLEAIVRLLMKGDPRDSRCFPWYERAVAKQIRVLRLYEYYVESMPPESTGILPAVIRRYFAYNNTLSDEGRASLYAAVVRSRADDPETFRRYHDTMEAFAAASLRQGRISVNYAALYQELIERLPDEASAATMTRLLFTFRLYTDDRTVTSAVVIHRELAKETSVPFSHGVAWIERYTPDARILLEDREGRRYAVTKAYACGRLMEDDRFREMCVRSCPSDPGIIVSRIREFERKEIADAEAFRMWKRAEASEEMSDAFREEVRRRILGYILVHPENSFFTDETDPSVLERYAEADPALLVRVLTAGGQYQSAARALASHGFERVDPALIAQLASHLIRNAEDREDEELLQLSVYAFRSGRFDEEILHYLMLYFRGGLKEMLAVREKAAAFSAGTRAMDERILARMIFTKSSDAEGPSVLRTYVGAGGDAALARRYLAFYADAMLGEPGRIDPWTASFAGSQLRSGDITDGAVKLLYLRAVSEKYSLDREVLTAEEKQLTEILLEESRARGLFFRFYQDLPDSFVSGLPVRDRIFIEKKVSPADRVTIHYRLSADGGKEEEPWQTENCERIFRGICSRTFTLFYGETLEYYLTVTHEGEETDGPRTAVTSSASDLQGTGCYQRINRMLKAKADGDTDALRKELLSFRRARRQAERLFRPE